MTDFFYQASLRILPALATGLMWPWFASCRLRVRGGEEMRTLLARGENGIAAFWHYSFLYLFFHLRAYSAAVMVSASRDGEYIARLAARFGHTPVRGSSNRRGFRALREMLVELQRGQNCAIVADGSQGPARRAQAGCILMASRSGRPIFPMAWAASRCIIFKSWDRTVLPLPFSTIVLHHGEPLYVPPDLSAEDTELWRHALEERLNQLYLAVWQELGRGPHDRAAVTTTTNGNKETDEARHAG